MGSSNPINDVNDAINDAGNAINDAGNAINNGINDAGNAIIDTGNTINNGIIDAGNAINDGIIDAGNAIVNVATDTYNYSVAFVNDTAKRTESAAATVAKNTEEFGKAGLDVANQEFIDLSKKAEQQIVAGVEVIEHAAEYAYAWLDENACRIGLTSAISMGCVAAFTPAQPAGAATSTTLSFMATPILYTADMAAKMAVATAMGEIIGNGFLAIPGVAGSVDAQLLKNVISNCVYYSLDCAALWGTPAGVGIAIGSAVAPVVASLVCTRTCPNGFSKALAA